MKKVKKRSFIVIAMLFLLFLLGTKSNASYSIKNINMQANINENGSLDIREEIDYSFSSNSNEIYVAIPKSLNDIESNSVPYEKGKEIDEQLYSADEIRINNIRIKDDKKSFKGTESGYGGMNYAYTLKDENDMYVLKMYKSDLNGKKTFVIDYTLDNICVNHTDFGELYYNFLGKYMTKKIDNVNIDIFLPKKNKSIYTWKHGTYKGTYKIESSYHVKFSFKDLKENEYTAIRLMFDRRCISDSSNNTGLTVKDIIFNHEDKILQNRNKRNNYEAIIYIMSFFIALYIAFFVVKFYKDRNRSKLDMSEEEYIEKFNPVMLGCMFRDRKVLSKDVIAIIIKLINSKNIKLDIRDEKYILIKNKEKEEELNRLDKVVYDLVFDEKEEINIKDFIIDLNKKGNSIEKIEKVQKEVKRLLYIEKIKSMKFKMIKTIINICIFICSMIAILFYYKSLGSILSISNDALKLTVYLIPMIFTIIYIFANIKAMIGREKVLFGKRNYIILGLVAALFVAILIYVQAGSFSKYLISIELLLILNAILFMLDNIIINTSIDVKTREKIQRVSEYIRDFLNDESNIKDNIEKVKEYIPYEICLNNGEEPLRKIVSLNDSDTLLKFIKNGLIVSK